MRSRTSAALVAAMLATGALGLAGCGSDSSSGDPLPASTPDLTIPGGAHRVDVVGPALLAEQVHVVPGAGQRGRQQRVVDVRAGAVQQVAVEDEDSHAAAGESSGFADRYSARMALQHYRFRTPSTGREVILPADPDRVYRDRDTGEELEVVGAVLPMAPSESRLPWAVENLRFCNWCDQLAQRDLNDCPTCGRRMAPLAS